MRDLYENLFEILVKHNDEDSIPISNIVKFYEAFEIKKHLIIVLEPS